MKIAVQGLWHLGSVTAGCLSSLGHEVIGLDFNQEIIKGLNSGSPPIYEPGLEEMIKSGLAKGKLEFITKAEQLPPDLELLWVTYDTPVNDDDVADTDFVIGQVAAVFPYLPPQTTVLVSSQMPVGSVRRLEALVWHCHSGKGISFASSPENLRLGRSLELFLKPDRIIVGLRCARDRERLQTLLSPLTDRLVWMSVESAEMTKHAINAFLATSIVFANEIAALCETMGADAREVERGLKSEKRIGPQAYLSPGGAFGGGTLARDVEFLKEVSRGLGITLPLMEAVLTSNNLHKTWSRRKLQELFPDLQGKTIAVWGLTYKPGTDTMRRSLAVEMCNWLIAQKAAVRVHDPLVKTLPAEWEGIVQRFADPLVTLTGANGLIVGTEWPEYKKLPGNRVVQAAPGLAVIDPNGFLSFLGEINGIRYRSVGAASSRDLLDNLT